MRKWAAFLVCGALLVPAALSAANDPQEEKNVLATLEALSQANIKQDRKALTALISDSVSYGHSSGEVMNKQVSIDYMLARDTLTLKWEKPVVTIIGGMAMVRAIQIVQIRDRKTKKVTDSGSHVFWVLHKGPGPYGWQIAARQNFRPEAEEVWLKVRDSK